MLQPKLIQSLILLLFIGVVTLGIFFLVSMQLAPIMDDVANEVSATQRIRPEVAVTQLTPTATMPALTLDMLATVQPTVAPTAPIEEESLPQSAVSAPIDPNARVGIVTSDLINIRSHPSLAGEVVGQAKQGDRLEIIITSNDGQWFQVCCPLGTAEGYQQSWVAAEFITIQPPVLSNTTGQSAAAVTAIPAPESGLRVTAANTMQSDSDRVLGTINGTLVNVRSGPGITYAMVGQASEGTQVEITGRDETGTWWRICCPVGAPTDSWISAELVDLVVAKAEVMVRVPVVPAPTMTPTSATGSVDRGVSAA